MLKGVVLLGDERQVGTFTAEDDKLVTVLLIDPAIATYIKQYGEQGMPVALNFLTIPGED